MLKYARCQKKFLEFDKEVAIPTQIPVVSMEDPPYDIKGRGSPTIGSNPATIPMFIRVCQKKIDISPITTMESNILGTEVDNQMKRNNKKR